MSTTTKVFAFAFNAAAVTPQAPMEALPKGWYPVAISDIELVLTGAGDGQRIKTEWTVTDGQMKGRKIFDGFNVANPNPKAQEIGASQFSALCHSVGVVQVTDLRQLLNIPHQILVSLDAERWELNGQEVAAGTVGATQYNAKNSFKGVKPLGAVAPGAASPAAAPNWAVAGGAPAPVSPVAPVPAAAAPAPVAAPAAPRGRGRPPKTPPAAPAPVAAVPAPERQFWVNMEGPQFANLVGENTIKAWLAQGMPATIELCLDGEEVYKTPAQHGIGVVNTSAPVAPAPVAAPAAAPTFVPQPAAAPVAPVPAAAAAPQVPQWAR